MARRRTLATALAAILALPCAGNAQPVGALRIGFVIPSKTGEEPVRYSSVNDYTGEGALMGARLADATVGGEMQARGLKLDLLYANSPSAGSVERAARRLVELDRVSALVGGIGDGQAEALSALAAELGVPFFNIGSTDDALRGEDCNRFSFHVEASDSMYIDAMAVSAAAQGARRWFVIHEDGAAGSALREVARAAIEDVGGSLVGSAAVPKGSPVYFDALQRAAESGADLLVALVDPMDQMVLLEQQESVGTPLRTMSLPSTLTQTRDYVAAARYNAPSVNPRHRVGLWETTLATNGAGPFNDSYSARWAEPVDPTAWSAYAAVRILAETALATGSTAPDDIIAYLESAAATFDVLKSTEVSFRPWDHQLRQPLYDVVVDQEADWERMSLASRIGIAGLGGEIPAAIGEDPVAALDRLGASAAQSACRF